MSTKRENNIVSKLNKLELVYFNGKPAITKTHARLKCKAKQHIHDYYLTDFEVVEPACVTCKLLEGKTVGGFLIRTLDKAFGENFIYYEQLKNGNLVQYDALNPVRKLAIVFSNEEFVKQENGLHIISVKKQRSEYKIKQRLKSLPAGVISGANLRITKARLPIPKEIAGAHDIKNSIDTDKLYLENCIFKYI